MTGDERAHVSAARRNEMARLYRAAGRGQLSHEEARSHIWMLERIGQRLEVIALEELHSKLGELSTMASNGQVINGESVSDRNLIAAG
jgi:hypothetical protein